MISLQPSALNCSLVVTYTTSPAPHDLIVPNRYRALFENSHGTKKKRVTQNLTPRKVNSMLLPTATSRRKQEKQNSLPTYIATQGAVALYCSAHT